MSIVKRNLILHTYENVHYTKYGKRCSYQINNMYPSRVLPNDYHGSTKQYKMLFERSGYSTIIYVEWLKDKYSRDEKREKFFQ